MYWVYSDLSCIDSEDYAAWSEGFYMSLAIFISVYLAAMAGIALGCHKYMVKNSS